MSVVDLSQPLTPGMQVYPGDPEFRTEPATTVANDGVNVMHVHLGTHAGTHVDAPYHVFPDGQRLEELSLDQFCGPAVIVDVRDKTPRDPIDWSDLAPWADRLGPGAVLVIHTGWSRHFGTPAYLDHPWLTENAARHAVELGVRSLAVDTLNPDETSPDGELPVHRVVLGAGGVIVENLTNLAAIVEPDPFISFFPIHLVGADGAPVRAVSLSPSPRHRPAAPGHRVVP